ncbi:MAG: SGNH/GDSL hydrolase family protein [Prevotella sp.]|nr:SGNH/GDSL hydrolase family protein [Prevotella sp.]
MTNSRYVLMWHQTRRIVAVTLLLLMAVQVLPQSLIHHPWQGKRVAYFGDSITDPRNNGSKKKYWGFLEDWLQITPYVYGVSGRQWNDIPRQTDKLLQEHGQDVDAILIFCGTNDYNNGVPIGQWWDERVTEVMYGHGQPKQMVTRRQRTPSMDPTTLKGRINIAMDSLKRTFPTKQIVLLTPIHRSDFHANEKNWQCNESYTNQCGEYIDAYIEAVKEAGNVWSVPVLDWNASSGLFPLIKEHAQYFKDGETDLLHPNDEGHQRMARTLMYQLLALPCTF